MGVTRSYWPCHALTSWLRVGVASLTLSRENLRARETERLRDLLASFDTHSIHNTEREQGRRSEVESACSYLIVAARCRSSSRYVAILLPICRPALPLSRARPARPREKGKGRLSSEGDRKRAIRGEWLARDSRPNSKP